MHRPFNGWRGPDRSTFTRSGAKASTAIMRVVVHRATALDDGLLIDDRIMRPGNSRDELVLQICGDLQLSASF